MEYKLGIYDLCGRNNFLKMNGDSFCVVSKGDAPAYRFSEVWLDRLQKHGVTTNQLFITVP